MEVTSFLSFFFFFFSKELLRRRLTLEDYPSNRVKSPSCHASIVLRGMLTN